MWGVRTSKPSPNNMDEVNMKPPPYQQQITPKRPPLGRGPPPINSETVI